MKAINVKGVETLKHYPKEPMTTQEGFLTEDQLDVMHNRQLRLIARLQRSNEELSRLKSKALDMEYVRSGSVISDNPSIFGPLTLPEGSLTGRFKHQKIDYSELEKRMAQAILDQAEINQAKRERRREAIARANLTYMKSILGMRQEPEQPDLFADIPVGKGKDWLG